jgi:hypothetical protein
MGTIATFLYIGGGILLLLFGLRADACVLIFALLISAMCYRHVVWLSTQTQCGATPHT